MNRLMKSAVLTLAVAATSLSALPAAEARDGWRRHHNNWGHHHNSGDLVAAGVLGLAVGALVAGASAGPEPEYYEPEPVYRQPRPRPHPDRGYYVDGPQVVYAEPVGGAEPWSRDWYEYCSERYRSFNPSTGTFTGYDGLTHFCEAN